MSMITEDVDVATLIKRIKAARQELHAAIEAKRAAEASHQCALERVAASRKLFNKCCGELMHAAGGYEPSEWLL